MAPEFANLIYEVSVSVPVQAYCLISQVHSGKSIDDEDETDAQARYEAMVAILTGIQHNLNGNINLSANALVRATIDILLKRDLCDFTVADFNGTKSGLQNVRYFQLMLRILHASISMLAPLVTNSRGHADEATHSHELPLYLKRVVTILTRVWEAKDTILHLDASSNLHTDVVHVFRGSVALYRVCTAPAYLPDLESSPAFHILIEIWLKNTSPDVRYQALEAFDEAINLANTASPGAFRRLYATSPRLCKQMIQGGLRDLRQPRCNTLQILTLHSNMPAARVMSRGIKLRDTIDYKVFQVSMATFRTLMCSSWQNTSGQMILSSEAWYSDYIRLTWGGEPRSNPTLSEEDLFYMVCVINNDFETTIQEIPTDILDAFKKTLEETRRVLVILCHKVENRRDTLVGEQLSTRRRDYLRSFCRAFWSATIKSVRENSPMKHDSTLQRALDVYIRFGRLLGLGDPTNISPYPSLDIDSSPRVCHWRGCLCSVSEPVHRLKECKGCRKAFYCNSNCQTIDWDEGGHKEVCGVSLHGSTHLREGSQTPLMHDPSRYTSVRCNLN